MQDSKRDTEIKNKLLDSMGEGEGGMIWHWNMYIIICGIDHHSRFDACSGLVHWDDPEGWDGEGAGREVRYGEHMYIHGWFMSMYGKNHYNIVIVASN